MMFRIRLVTLLARPAVIALLVLFAATGAAQQGGRPDGLSLGLALAAVLGFLLFSVACNDLADEEIDRVNLPGRRPLADGLLGRREFAIIGVTAGAAALAASALLGWAALVVLAAGLAVSAAYSVRPVRLADRGAVASLVLPACYVAVPYLLGVLARSGGRWSASVRPGTLLLLGGLYLGFIGRILLKDFRDVRGDALFGKRTFLVRHGRTATCLFSGGCWILGTVAIIATTRQLTIPLAAADILGLAGTVVLLRALDAGAGARRDEAIVAAIAIIGRSMILLLLAHLSMRAAGWSPLRYDAVVTGLSGLTAAQVVTMLRHGPASGLTVPGWLMTSGGRREPVSEPCAKVGT